MAFVTGASFACTRTLTRGGLIADFSGKDDNYSDNQYAGSPATTINDKTSSAWNNTPDKCWRDAKITTRPGIVCGGTPYIFNVPSPDPTDNLQKPHRVEVTTGGGVK